MAFVVTAALYPWLTWKGIMGLPIIWAIFESTHKSLYRKDLKCPYCGFDPKWYRKDVKLARQKVEEFIKQNPDSPVFKRAQPSKENPLYFYE
jgi:ribosomal protein S14